MSSCKIYHAEKFRDLIMSNEDELSKYTSSVASSKLKTTSKTSRGGSTTTNDSFQRSSTGSSINRGINGGSSQMSNQSTLQPPASPKTMMERALEHHRKAIKNPKRGRKDKFMASHSRLFEAEIAKQRVMNRKNADRIHRVRQKKEAAFQNNWSNLHAGKDFDLHNEWGHRLKLLDQEKLNRKKALARKWNEEVYEPIKERVQQHAEDLRLQGIHHTRREEYNNFIEAVNLKGGLFLDEVDEAEYDPNVVNRMAGTVQIEVNDPTIRTLQRQHEEKIMNPADHHLGLKKTNLPGGLPKYKTKGTLNIKVWGKGKIEATPHGHFAAMHDRDGAPRRIPDMPATRVTLKPGYFDVFNVPKSLALMDEEWASRFGKGKKCTSRPIGEIKIGQPLG